MKRPVVTRYEITTEYPMSAPIRIAHVSDLHERRADDILELLRQASPDFVAVTGDTLERYDNRPQYDFVHKPIKRLIINILHWGNHFLRRFEGKAHKPDTANARAFLAAAAEVAPVYLSLGNHEEQLLDSDRQFYREQGIRLLDNACVKVNIKGFDMNIGGMSSWDFEAFLAGFARADGFKLLLCHHPERFEPFIQDTPVDLTLSGHTHGGQIRIGRKGRGFFVPGQWLFGRYAHGCFFDGRLIVSAGCSNTVAMPRWGNPRELVVVDLKGKNHEEL